MRTIYIAISTLMLLASCTATRAPLGPSINTLFTVQINQSFKALPNYTRLYFQQGRQLGEAALDRWAVYCQLYVFNPDEGAGHKISVNPGSLRITRVRNRVRSSDFSLVEASANTVAWMTSMPGTQVSADSPGLTGLAMGTDGDGPPDYYLYQVEMTLAAANQPDIRSLTCLQRWGSAGNHYPTLDEMRGALGNLLKIHPPAISSSL